MKLLILTQKVDREDPVLGFFHNWIYKLANKFENISVICLEKGEFNLPSNVAVYSLGKEKRKSKIKYLARFYNLILGLHKDYDAVLVHMNQEYVILGGFLWKVMGKKVYMWRNHAKGNLLTRMAVWICNKVFYTSSDSFTAKYNKSVRMPVGIDTELFNDLERARSKNSILSLGRISPVKNIHLMVDAAKILKAKNINFNLDIVGDGVNYEDSDYKKDLMEKSIGLPIHFFPPVPNYQTRDLYNSHQIFLNLTPSGSFDKTILEAAACGCITIISNTSIQKEIPENLIAHAAEEVAEKIKFWLDAPEAKIKETSLKLQTYVQENHSLNKLIEKLNNEIIDLKE